MGIFDRAVVRYDRTMSRVRRRSHRFDHAWRAADRYHEVLAGRLAAAISYYGFFAAFSLAVLAYSILGRMPRTNGGGPAGAVDDYLAQALPWVRRTAQEVGAADLTAIGVAALLITGVSWVAALRTSTRAIWKVDQHPGNWLVRRFIDLGMLLALGLLLGLSLAARAAVDRVLGWLTTDVPLADTIIRLTGAALEFGVNVALAAALLTAVPRLRLSARRLIPTALAVAVTIQLLHTLGRWYVDLIESRAAYQLITGGAVGLLVYLYLLNQIILFGSALAATATRGRMIDMAAGGRGELPGRAAENTASRTPAGRRSRDDERRERDDVAD